MTDDPCDEWPLVRFGRNIYVAKTDRYYHGYAIGGTLKLFDKTEPTRIIDIHPTELIVCRKCARPIPPGMACYGCTT